MMNLKDRIGKHVTTLTDTANKEVASLTAKMQAQIAKGDFDSVQSGINSINAYKAFTESVEAAAMTLVNAVSSPEESTPRVPKGIDIHGQGQLDIEEPEAPKRGRGRGTGHKRGAATAPKATRSTHNASEFTSGAAYEPFLLQAFRQIGGEGQFFEAQKAMKDIMKEQGAIKPLDEALEGTPPRRRINYLSGSRKSPLVKDGYLEEFTEQVQVEDGKGGTEMKDVTKCRLTKKGEEMVDKLLAGEEVEIGQARPRGRRPQPEAAAA